MIRAAIAGGLVAAGLATPAAAAVVREARVTVVFSPGACDVTTRVAIDTVEPGVIEHRLMIDRPDPPGFVVVGGIAGRTDVVSRTARLRISIAGSGRNEYTVRYRAPLADGPTQRCPLLVPGVPTDGVSRGVRLDVEVPDGATVLPGQFPAFTWNDRRGSVTIGHMPAFVRVPHLPRGAPVTWRDGLDVERLVDTGAIAVIGASTLAWIARRRRRA